MQLIKQKIYKNSIVATADLLSSNPKGQHLFFPFIRPALRVMNATSGTEHKSCSLPQMQF